MTAIILSFLKFVTASAAIATGLYATLLVLLTRPSFQAHIVYLHKIQTTWFKDLNIPESFGFPRNQVTPFAIKIPYSGASLYAWHILPINLYRQHESALINEPSGFTSDIQSRTAFKLLRDDPAARLVIHMHGAAGTVASGYRLPNYRALSAGDPDKIHVLAFDYRGFGMSQGVPSEGGLKQDASAVVEWAMKTAGISPSRIILFGQSIGTAVTLAICEYYALQSLPVIFAGAVLVAPFADVASLVATYRVAGFIPLLAPLARFPRLLRYLRTYIRDRWSSKDRIAGYIQANETNGRGYKLTLIHAEDDWDIPYHHTEILFWHAVKAMASQDISYEELEARKNASKTDLGAAGTVMEWRTRNGVVREEILKTGLHDVVMGNPVVTMAVMRIFDDSNNSKERAFLDI
ncbi:MAG: hypothetical protein Q9169_006970 [Polycauliona sp. 2 TL-2023]